MLIGYSYSITISPRDFLGYFYVRSLQTVFLRHDYRFTGTFPSIAGASPCGLPIDSYLSITR